jgi:hypothetical protein
VVRAAHHSSFSTALLGLEKDSLIMVASRAAPLGSWQLGKKYRQRLVLRLNRTESRNPTPASFNRQLPDPGRRNQGGFYVVFSR